MPWNEIDPWSKLVVLVLGIILTTQVALRVLRPVLRRLLTRSPVLLSMMQRCGRPAQLTLPLMVLQIFWPSVALDLPGFHVLQQTISVSFIMALTWLMLAALRGLTDGLVSIYSAESTDNLMARRIQTQVKVLSRIASGMVLIAGFAFVLMSFPGAKQFGASLLASAGVAGLVAGIAARSVLSNFLAGLQIVLTQPIRIDDVLVVENLFGRVEEITATYVVLKVWDERRLIVPLGWFIERPFENWTRTTSNLLGTVFLWVDFSCPLDAVRSEARRICEASALWDKRVCQIQITDANEHAMQIRVLVSSAASGPNFDLRCELREKLIGFIAKLHPQSLPLLRTELYAASQASIPDPLLASHRLGTRD